MTVQLNSCWSQLRVSKSMQIRVHAPISMLIYMISVVSITWTPDILPYRPLTWNRNKCPCFCTFPLEFGGVSDLHIHNRTEGLYVKTTIIHQLKRLCVPDCAYTENMFINSIHISLYDISLTQNILYQIKRDVAVWKRLGCPQRNQRTWWQIMATPYTGLALFPVEKCDSDFKSVTKLGVGILSIQVNLALERMPKDLVDG